MKKFYVVFFVLFLTSVSAFSQKRPIPKIISEEFETPTEQMKTFIPNGYLLLKGMTGNLNLDKFPDAVLVLKKANEEELSRQVEDQVKRPLLILIGQADKSYKLAGRNDNTVFCYSCGGVFGDPFAGIEIKNGTFSILHYGGSGWRWTHTVLYKYAPTQKKWFLFRNETSSFHAAEPDKVNENIQTPKNFGRIPFEKFDIYAPQK